MYKKGFTLIELMVTIVVLAVLAMIAAPSMATLLAKQKLNRDTSALMDALARARSQAATIRQTTTVYFYSGTDTVSTFYWTPDSKTTLTSPSVTSVSFKSDGTLVTQTALSFVLCSSGSSTTRTFSLSIMGMVYATPSTDGTC